MKKLLIISATFAAGVCVGVLVKGLLDKRKVSNEVPNEDSNTDSDDSVSEHDCASEETEAVNEGSDIDEESVSTDEVVSDQVPEEEDDEPDEEEEELLQMGERARAYRAKHKGKIELIPKSEWESNFPEVAYDRQELWYFPDEGTLTDEEGNELDLYEYVGNCFDKINFYTSTDEECWIRHNPKETDYYVHKELELPKDIFFNN